VLFLLPGDDETAAGTAANIRSLPLEVCLVFTLLFDLRPFRLLLDDLRSTSPCRLLLDDLRSASPCRPLLDDLRSPLTTVSTFAG
jgi:hypothetical protein